MNAGDGSKRPKWRVVASIATALFSSLCFVIAAALVKSWDGTAQRDREDPHEGMLAFRQELLVDYPEASRRLDEALSDKTLDPQARSQRVMAATVAEQRQAMLVLSDSLAVKFVTLDLRNIKEAQSSSNTACYTAISGAVSTQVPSPAGRDERLGLWAEALAAAARGAKPGPKASYSALSEVRAVVAVKITPEDRALAEPLLDGPPPRSEAEKAALCRWTIAYEEEMLKRGPAAVGAAMRAQAGNP